MADDARVHALVTGSVQGVGFRYSAQQEARRLGLAGVVRNLADGAVEVEAEGAAADVAAFVEWLGVGPACALVQDVWTRELSPTGEDGFHLEH